MQKREQSIEEIPLVRPVCVKLTTGTGVCAQCGDVESTIVRGDAPQNLAALRNAGLNWLRTQKTDNITATLRSFVRNSFRLLSKPGYPN